MSYVATDDLFCEQCKGSCWDSSNNAKTQAAAHKKFGIIPNNCVNDENGTVRCPYAAK